MRKFIVLELRPVPGDLPLTSTPIEAPDQRTPVWAVNEDFPVGTFRNSSLVWAIVDTSST
jgi:hypothetical protein